MGGLRTNLGILYAIINISIVYTITITIILLLILFLFIDLPYIRQHANNQRTHKPLHLAHPLLLPAPAPDTPHQLPHTNPILPIPT